MKNKGRPNNNPLIILIVVAGVLLIVTAALLVRTMIERPQETDPTTTTTQSAETTAAITTETPTQPQETSVMETTLPAQTSQTPTTDGTTAETTGETTAEISVEPDEAVILDIIHRGELLALELFTEAFEAERNDGVKKQFSEIRPQLLEFWSETIIDESLAPFYEEYLDIWAYEMMYYFPLASEDCVYGCFTEMVAWSDEEIIAEFLILDEMTDESFLLHVVLIPAESNWIINDRYSPGW